MSATQAIHAHLAAVPVAGGIHQSQNRKSPPTLPFIVVTTISAPINNTLRGQSDLQNYIYQIDVFAKKISDAEAIAKMVAMRMEEFRPSSVRTDFQDDYEEGIKAHRVRQDFSVWSID